jgi:hypothetical protein
MRTDKELDGLIGPVKTVLLYHEETNLLLETVIYAPDGMRIEEISHNGDGDIKGIPNYDEKGRITKLAYFNADGTLYRWRDYIYDNDNGTVEWITYSDKGLITARQICKNDADGKVIAVDYYTPDGTLEERRTCKYDEGGILKETLSYQKE